MINNNHSMLYIKKRENIKEISQSEFNKVIDSVDLYDVCKYIKLLDTESWVPGVYWSRARVKLYKENKKNLFADASFGEMMWAIYSYLVHNEILMIEDQYGYNNELRTKDGYYNPLENQLYSPIISRLVDEKFLTMLGSDIHGFNKYKIGPSYYRINNLEKLNI